MSAAPNPTALLPLAGRDFLILLALVDERLHGYGLLKAIVDATHGEVAMDPANLYRALRRMRRDGLVTESDLDEDRRRYYALTALGRRVVKAEAQRIDRLAAAVRAKKLVSKAETR